MHPSRSPRRAPSLRRAAVLGCAALITGMALVACGDAATTTNPTGAATMPMTDAEFCAAAKTGLTQDAKPAAPGDVTTTTDPRVEFDHLRSIADRAPAAIHAPMTVYFEAITKVFDTLYPSGDQPSTTMGMEALGEISKVMAGQPVKDALKALETYGADTCKFTAADNPFSETIKSSGGLTTSPTDNATDRSSSGSGSDAKLPDGFDAALQAHLISVGIGSETDKPMVELTNFQRAVTVTVSTDIDPVAACAAASDFAFGDSAPAAAAQLVTIEQGFDTKIVAQRKPTDAECLTTGFVYHYISDYLHAEHADATWIDRISGGGYSSTGDGYAYSVDVSEGTTGTDALDICAQSAGYAFGPRVDPPATSLEIQLSSASGGATQVLAHATSTDDCAAGPAS